MLELSAGQSISQQLRDLQIANSKTTQFLWVQMMGYTECLGIFRRIAIKTNVMLCSDEEVQWCSNPVKVASVNSLETAHHSEPSVGDISRVSGSTSGPASSARIQKKVSITACFDKRCRLTMDGKPKRSCNSSAGITTQKFKIKSHYPEYQHA